MTTDSIVFVSGDRIEMTDEAIAMKLDGRYHKRTGTVKKSRDYEPTMTVFRDGQKQSERWSKTFWKKIL